MSEDWRDIPGCFICQWDLSLCEWSCMEIRDKLDTEPAQGGFNFEGDGPMLSMCSEAGSKRACGDCKRDPDNVPDSRSLVNASWVKPPEGEKCPLYAPLPARRELVS